MQQLCRVTYSLRLLFGRSLLRNNDPTHWGVVYCLYCETLLFPESIGPQNIHQYHTYLVKKPYIVKQLAP